MTLVLLALERLAGVGIFDPALGGDPLLFRVVHGGADRAHLLARRVLAVHARHRLEIWAALVLLLAISAVSSHYNLGEKRCRVRKVGISNLAARFCAHGG
jgi:hypothetical protein